ncbi:MAG TPA: DUF1343 domain-containing protein [Spirochaetia bacterium]|nr:DUF1343 domain-containing protein [Spirochaetia bacterium]
MASNQVRTGLDRIDEGWPKELRGARIGLLVHPASVNGALVPAVRICESSKEFALSVLFGPQHGILGQTQDNMIEWEGFKDPVTGLPVYSLYGNSRRPRPEMLDGIDALVVDLQDVGSRYYTFIWTLELCMEACAEAGKRLVVLDRPNPLDASISSGPVLREKFASFVGLRPLPIRHGMTIAEIGAYLRATYHPNLQYHVIRMEGYRRSTWFDETGLPWVMPSPNIPTLDSAIVYPGMCLLEGTGLSEGRGTTRPFEIFGAPFIDADRLVRNLTAFKLPGVLFRPLSFEPTFQKHSGTLCGGAQLHVTDRDRFDSFKTGVAVLKAIHDSYPGKLKWNEPPYEYEEHLLPIDIIAGTDRLRLDIDRGASLEEMESWWNAECEAFKPTRESFLLY